MDVATLISQTVPDILAAITGSPVRTVTETEIFGDEERSTSIVAVSGLKGDISGILAMRCSQRTAENLFDRVVDGYAKKSDDNVRDLIAEILNLIIGQIKAGLLIKGKEVRHSIPSVLSYDPDTPFPYAFDSEPPIVLDSDVGRFHIHFVPMEEGLQP